MHQAKMERKLDFYYKQSPHIQQKDSQIFNDVTIYLGHKNEQIPTYY